jgi:hypothetical protein
MAGIRRIYQGELEQQPAYQVLLSLSLARAMTGKPRVEGEFSSWTHAESTARCSDMDPMQARSIKRSSTVTLLGPL